MSAPTCRCCNTAYSLAAFAALPLVGHADLHEDGDGALVLANCTCPRRSTLGYDLGSRAGRLARVADAAVADAVSTEEPASPATLAVLLFGVHWSNVDHETQIALGNALADADEERVRCETCGGVGERGTWPKYTCDDCGGVGEDTEAKVRIVWPGDEEGAAIAAE
jgi:hypothetical protein